MDKPISVGDLVVVTRTCCGRYVGYVFVVKDLFADTCYCKKCGTAGNGWMFASTGKKDNPHHVPVQYLRRIPPLDEMEDVRRDEEITA